MPKTIHSPEQVALQELLRELRNQAGLGQTEVAAMLKRPQSFVSKYEAGERLLDVIELRAVCGALGLSLEAFVRQLEKRLRGL